jgi:hypothetical protein
VLAWKSGNKVPLLPPGPPSPTTYFAGCSSQVKQRFLTRFAADYYGRLARFYFEFEFAGKVRARINDAR